MFVAAVYSQILRAGARSYVEELDSGIMQAAAVVIHFREGLHFD